MDEYTYSLEYKVGIYVLMFKLEYNKKLLRFELVFNCASASHETFLPDTVLNMKPFIHYMAIWFMIDYVKKRFPKKERMKMAHGRSKFLGSVIAYKAKALVIEAHNMTEEEFWQLSRICFKLRPVTKKNSKGKYRAFSDYHFRDFLIIREKNKPLYNYIISDFIKYPTTFCKYIIRAIESLKDLSLEDYNTIITNAPHLIRKCKYNIDYRLNKFIEVMNPRPQNRYQFFIDAVMMVEFGRRVDLDGSNLEIIKKFKDSEIKCWHTFKKYRHHKGPYSCRKLAHMMDIVFDGKRMAKQYEGMVEVKGSALHMLKAAIFNHRKEEELRKDKLLKDKDFNLPLPAVKLPIWIEEIRIKTSHELIKAGIECNHCLGSYTNSKDIFVREDKVCAQIYDKSFTIGQCYDEKDTITKASRSLKTRLKKDLQNIQNKT